MRPAISTTVGSVVDHTPPSVRRIASSPGVHALALVLVAALLVFLWGPLSYSAYVVQLICVYAIAVLGLNLPAGYAGALSLGQGAAFAVGAYLTGIAAGTHGWPIWAALPIALAGGLLVGLATGLPAGRFGVIGLAMVSLGSVLVVTDLLTQFRDVTGGANGISGIDARMSFGGDPVSTYWAVPVAILLLAGLSYWAHARYRTSRLGRATTAVRDEPIGAGALGISGYVTKVSSFALGSGLGGLAGGLFAYLSQYISPDAVTPQLSILLLVMVVLGGAGSRFGPVLGCALLVLIPLQLDQYPHVNVLVYGALLVGLIRLRPRGLVGRTSAPVPAAALDRVLDAAAVPATDAPTPSAPSDELALELRDVRRTFGSVAALDGISATVRSGEILGLIGPNGSGKTTALNVIGGLYPATSGEVLLGGTPVQAERPMSIARRGVARTFQTPKTFPGMSVAEHLALATPSAEDADPVRRAACLAGARELLRLGGLNPDDPAGLGRETRGLAHGQLRFLEAAMAIGRVPRVLLLDEPAAGLSAAEIEGFERVVRDVARAGVAVIIVEHHLEMIGRLVDRVVVLDLGRVLWTGLPQDLHDEPTVRAAYTGAA